MTETNIIMNEEIKEKALALVNAYFDESKTILVKDPQRGIKDWVSIKDPNYWTFIDLFIKNVEKYKVIDND